MAAAADHLQAGGDAGDLRGAPGVKQSDAYRVLRGKRTLNTSVFFQDPHTAFRLLSLLVVAVPVDKLHHTIFESESFAKRCGGRPGGRERVGLLQPMVSRTGILQTVHRMLASGLISANSDLAQLSAMAIAQGLSDTHPTRIRNIHRHSGVTVSTTPLNMTGKRFRRT